MKKTLLALILFLSIQPLAAQKNCRQEHWRFGVVGGVNLTQVENYGSGTYAFFDYKPSWHAGLAAQYKWGRFLNYSLQPELRYMATRTDIESVYGTLYGQLDLGMVEMPVNFQFGLQLSKIFRPFVQAGTYFTYLAYKGGDFTEMAMQEWEELNRFSMGLGAGVGFDLWKFQVQCKYHWGLTPVNHEKTPFSRMLIKGYEFSLGILF